MLCCAELAPYKCSWVCYKLINGEAWGSLNAYPCKINRLEKLKPGDNDLQDTFALTVLARMEEQNWLWDILWTDEAHFYMWGTEKTHNYCIWSTESPNQFQQMPLNSLHFTATDVIRSFLFIYSFIYLFIYRVTNSARTKNLFCNCSLISKHAIRYCHFRTPTAWLPRNISTRLCSSSYCMWGF